MRRQLIFIGIFVGLAAGTAFYLGATQDLLAALFGGGITLNNVLLQQWHLRKAKRQARADAGHNLRIMMSCALQRFIATVVLFALGMGALQLPPLALLAGFGAALVAQYVGDPNFKTLRT